MIGRVGSKTEISTDALEVATDRLSDVIEQLSWMDSQDFSELRWTLVEELENIEGFLVV